MSKDGVTNHERASCDPVGAASNGDLVTRHLKTTVCVVNERPGVDSGQSAGAHIPSMNDPEMAIGAQGAPSCGDILKPVRSIVDAHKAIAADSRTAMEAQFTAFTKSVTSDHPAILARLAYEHAWRHGALWATERAQRITREVFAGGEK